MVAAFSVSRVTTYIRIILKTCKVCQVMITHHSHCFGTVTFGRIPLQSLSLRYFLRMSLQIFGLRKIYGCDKGLNISNILINQYVDWCCCKSGRVLYILPQVLSIGSFLSTHFLTYLNMSIGTKASVRFLDDKALAHFSNIVCEDLTDKYSGKWIGKDKFMSRPDRSTTSIHWMFTFGDISRTSCMPCKR